MSEKRADSGSAARAPRSVTPFGIAVSDKAVSWTSPNGTAIAARWSWNTARKVAKH
jgi:hypothetical protein